MDLIGIISTILPQGLLISWISRFLGSKDNDSPSVGGSKQKQNVKQVGERRINIKTDRPIRTLDEDILGRTKLAQSFAEHIMALDASEGIVVGVLGPWGSGKTSFINLVRIHLEASNITVLNFNPWMFSGAHQLVDSFFKELSVQLKLHSNLEEIGKELEKYGELFSGWGFLPLAGSWIERGRKFLSILGRFLQRKKEGIGGLRAKVEKALATLDKPIVVVLDDIDRLNTAEIQDIFKLIRLTANFPNIVYIVAFDRIRVEEALTEQNLPGRDYLEKILQISIDLPVVPSHILNRQILEALDEALSGIDNPGPFDENIWTDVFIEIIRPLVKNMRDLRRYTAAVYGTVLDLNGQIALVDVLALEAIRIFLPDVFCQMYKSIDGLTTTSDFSLSNLGEPPYLKEQIDRLIAVNESNAEVIRAMIKRLFPAAERHIGGSHYMYDWKNQWLMERHVAYEDILRLYFERVVGEGLQAFIHAEKAWARMANRDEFDNYLRSLDPERLEDVITALETFEDKFSIKHVEPGAIVLLNILFELPDRPRGLLDLGPDLVVGRIVYRLLRSLKDPEKVEAAVRNILPHLHSLSAKEQLINMIGYRESVGHKLVSETAAQKFEEECRAEVRSASFNSLINEPKLFRILLRTKRETNPEYPPLEIPDSPDMTLAILRSAYYEVRSQTADSRNVKRSPRLAWDGLVELFEGEDILRERIEKLKATQPQGVDELIQLADKYIGGWRPDEYGND